jgi:hypothetical protein
MKASLQKPNEASAKPLRALRSAEARVLEDRLQRWLTKRRQLEAHYLATGGPAMLDYLHQQMTTKEAAEFLHTTTGQIYKLLYRGAIPCIPWGKNGKRFCRLDLIAWQDTVAHPAAG